jgi:ABC-type uncharacterized transport system ATPase subunit
VTRLLVILTIILLILAPIVAFAEEQPCRAEGDTVVCQREGFDVLVHKLVDAKASADACVVMREADAANLRVSDAKLAAAVASADVARAELAAEKAKPKPWARRFTALGAAAVGGVAVGLAPSVSSESVSAALLTVGVVGLATSVILVAVE